MSRNTSRPTTPQTSLDKMRELTRRLIAVPKSEITPKPKRKAKKRPR